MKTVFYSLLSLVALTSAAHADEQTKKILEHPVTTAIIQLMQSKHENKCTPITEHDIQWHCFGDLPSFIKEPMIIDNGCVFTLTLDCPSETAQISGKDSSPMILMPNGTILKNSDFNPSQLIIHSVEISEKIEGK
jgi:hypothetical protein